MSDVKISPEDAEMKKAVERISQIMVDTTRTTFGIEDFKTNEEQIGFTELIWHNYVEKPSGYVVGVFRPTEELLARIKDV